MQRMLLLVLALLLPASMVPVRAQAHSASTAYLNIVVKRQALAVQWSIALRDLDYAIGLDRKGDGTVTWGDVQARAPMIDAYALARLRLSSGGALCTPGPVTHLADELGDGGYVVLRFEAVCPRTPRAVAIHYDLLFDLDPLHRGLVNLIVGGTPHAAALAPDRRDITFDATPNLGATIGTFFFMGVEHLLTGLDHLLFLTMLLMPAMLLIDTSKPRRRLNFLPPRRVFIETVKVLSAFTLAHATTLTLSTLHLISIPERLSETGIAVTILLTALDNVLHVLPRKRWPLAFAFGLVHGLGFANALGPLDLPAVSLGVALLSFNLGLEAVQISLAAIVLSCGGVVRNSPWLRNTMVPTVSAAVAALAIALIVDRALGTGLIPI
jgi:hypothetical protein